ncbi:MAG: ATP-binding protein [Flavisolibacter sp.]
MKIAMKESFYPFLQGGGEMGQLTRCFDWANTVVGSPDQWPQSLRTTVSNLLRSKFPMFLWWGPDMIQFYNDAYRPSLGNNGKHPYALGQLGKECWPEIWDIISPLHRLVEISGEPTWMEDQLVPIYRNGKIEDVYWTFSYSSVLDDEGRHAGILVTCNETTEKVLNLKKLKESEDALRFAIEATELGTWDYDPVTNKFSANNRLKEWFGLPIGKEIDLQLAINVMAEEDRQRVTEAIKQTLLDEKGGQYRIEYTIIHPATGKKRIVCAKGRAWFNSDKKCYRFNGTLQDVTEQVKSNKEIEEKSQELQLAMQVADLGMFRIDLVRDKATYSQRVMDWFGFKEQGLNLQTVSGYVHPDDRERVVTALEHSVTSEENSRHDVTYRLHQPGRPGRYLRSFGKTDFNKEGKAYRMVGVIQDVSEQMLIREQLQQSEAALQNRVAERTHDLQVQKTLLDSVVSNSTSALLYGESIRDEKGRLLDFRIVLANDKAAELFGFSNIQEFSSQTIRQIHKRVGAEDITDLYIHIVESGEPNILVYQDASLQRWFTISTVKLRDGFLTTCTDITETKLLQYQLESAITELKRSNANLEEFAHAASHDLKEPIRKIHFFTRQLKDHLGAHSDGKDMKSFNRIEDAAQRMGNLIDDLLQYSHVSQRPHQMEAVDLAQTIRDVTEDLEIDIQGKKAVITTQNLPVVRGHKRQLQQLFQNLVSNGLKYSKPDVAPVLEFTAGRTLENNQPYYWISLKDNGIGFEQQYEDRIFQIFSRLHGKAEYSGTGVGLSIVKKVLENHKGFIRVESSPGEGANFSIYLPTRESS